MVRGFSRFVLFLFLGLLRAPTRNSPERVRDTIWTFPEKSGKHPGLETPRFSFSQLKRMVNPRASRGIPESHTPILHAQSKRHQGRSVDSNLIPFSGAKARFGSVRLRFGGGTVRAVLVFGSGGSSTKKFFFLCSLTGSDGSGSGFGSWKTVPAVPVPLSVSGKMVPTVPVSGSGSVPQPPCIFRSQRRTPKPKKSHEQHQIISERFEGTTQYNKGFEANHTRKFTRKFGEILVAKVLWSAFKRQRFPE